VRWFKSRDNLPLISTIGVFVALYLVAAWKFEGFRQVQVAFNLLADNAFLGVTAVGLTFVILSGGIDLSVGSMVGLAGILLSHLIVQLHWHPAAAAVVVLAVGLAIGLAQGWLIAKFDIAPFLVTLGGLFFCRGVALWISEESVDIQHPFFKRIVDFSIDLHGQPIIRAGTLVFIAAVILGAWAGKNTLFGRTIYAIGGSKSSAILMGLRVDRTLIKAYALSGFCSALGGLLFAIYTGSGNATAGTGMELDAIAAVVIGGTLLSGGYGSVLGSFVGTLILGVIQTAIVFWNINSWWTKIAVGGLLLVFMLLQRGLVKLSTKSSAN